MSCSPLTTSDEPQPKANQIPNTTGDSGYTKRGTRGNGDQQSNLIKAHSKFEMSELKGEPKACEK